MASTEIQMMVSLDDLGLLLQALAYATNGNTDDIEHMLECRDSGCNPFMRLLAAYNANAVLLKAAHGQPLGGQA